SSGSGGASRCSEAHQRGALRTDTAAAPGAGERAARAQGRSRASLAERRRAPPHQAERSARSAHRKLPQLSPTMAEGLSGEVRLPAALPPVSSRPPTPVGHDSTLSTRLVLPFSRAAGVIPEVVDELARMGIGRGEFSDPNPRLSHRMAVRLLET